MADDYDAAADSFGSWLEAVNAIKAENLEASARQQQSAAGTRDQPAVKSEGPESDTREPTIRIEFTRAELRTLEASARLLVVEESIRAKLTGGLQELRQRHPEQRAYEASVSLNQPRGQRLRR